MELLWPLRGYCVAHGRLQRALWNLCGPLGVAPERLGWSTGHQPCSCVLGRARAICSAPGVVSGPPGKGSGAVIERLWAVGSYYGVLGMCWEAPRTLYGALGGAQERLGRSAWWCPGVLGEVYLAFLGVS